MLASVMGWPGTARDWRLGDNCSGMRTHKHLQHASRNRHAPRVVTSYNTARLIQAGFFYFMRIPT